MSITRADQQTSVECASPGEWSVLVPVQYILSLVLQSVELC